MDERVMPEGFGHADYVGQTTLHPLGLVLTLACGFAMLFLPRRYAIWPMILMACFVAPAQRVVVFSLNFTLLRLLVVFGWLRVLTRNEVTAFEWKTLDHVMIAYSGTRMFAFTVLWGTADALKNQLGVAFDTLGMYFLFRCLIREWDDITQTVRAFILVSIPVCLAFLAERASGKNAFAFFGGVPEVTMVRAGRLRCQGAFAHPILAGCFWAALMPLIAARWWTAARERLWAIVGLGTCGVIVICCASGTPVMAVMSGLTAGGFFVLRHHMRLVRWGIVLTLISLHLVMKAPVWHLVSRVDVVAGNTGYHRYMLIDQAIRRVGEWWLLGTTSTAHWFWGAQDVTNQYVLEGAHGGLLTLALFIAAIVLAFRGVGWLWRAAGEHAGRAAMAWALGVSLFVHCMNFLGVSYFGQISFVWYLLLAMIGSVSPLAGPVSAAAPQRSRRCRPAFSRL